MEINFFVHSLVVTYLLIFFGMSLEAAVTLFATVFLVSQGRLDPLFALLVIILGAIFEQIVWYYIGRNLSRLQKLLHFSNKFIGHLDRHFTDRPLRVIVLSKFVYGLHRTALIRFGMLKFPLLKYLKSGTVAIALWLLIVGSIAFIFSASYDVLKHYFQYAEIIILIFVIIFIVAQYFISKRLKKNL